MNEQKSKFVLGGSTNQFRCPETRYCSYGYVSSVMMIEDDYYDYVSRFKLQLV